MKSNVLRLFPLRPPIDVMQKSIAKRKQGLDYREGVAIHGVLREAAADFCGKAR
ncbi:MAG: hypothetical protein ABSC37_06540 [Xanthobacteraceae bacterium]|jgi:hypothetical protein